MPNLNDKFIKLIPTPDNKNKIYWDDRITGLGIRITTNGVLSFILDYVINGRRRRYTIGRYPDLNTNGAREAATDLKGQIIRGHDPLERKNQINSALTLRELSEEFLKTKKDKLRPSTYESYKVYCLEKHILPKFGNQKINQINKKDIENFITSLAKTPIIANRVLVVMIMMFNTAISWNLIEKNPAQGIKKFPENKRERYLSQEEINKVLKAIDSEERQINAYLIKLILLTGSRKGEVLSAKWQEFDFENGIWTKPLDKTKQKKNSHIPLSEESLDILKKMRKKIVSEAKLENCDQDEIVSTETFLFYNPKTKKPLQDAKRLWKKICQKAGIKNARPNDLRHTFASHLVSDGVSLKIIGKLVGHSNIKTTQRYAHLMNKPLQKAANMFGKKLLGSNQ